MSSNDDFTAEELEQIASDATPDLPSGMPPLVTLLQSPSPQLQPDHPDFVRGACAGDFLLPYASGLVLAQRLVGIAFTPVAFETLWPQYLPFRGGWVVTHAEKPANAKWLKREANPVLKLPASPDGKQGYYLLGPDGVPGDKVEETAYCHMWVLPSDGRAAHPASFAFRSSSLPIGKDFEKRAARIEAKVNGGPLKGYVAGAWQLTSRSEKGDQGPYFVPVLMLLGKLGEERGPSVADVRMAAKLRTDFRAGLGASTSAQLTASASPAISGPPVPPEASTSAQPPRHDRLFDGPPEPPPPEPDRDGPDYSDRDERRDWDDMPF